ncbi:MAG: hypothetical protein IJT50_02100, partial [Lentisphaeria bacterium]|nr:hypothetical protein [Lentisphaeria bacterium]
KLIVTLPDMNTVELARAIQGKELLQCRATLTDSTSRVYLIPLTIRNRAIEGTPVPVAEYYTKSQIDTQIAGITAADIGALPDTTTAADIGALDAAGPEIVPLTGTTIALAEGKVFRHTLATGEVFTFDTSLLTASRQVTGEVHLIQPATAVSFTLPAGVLWESDGAFASGNDVPDFSTGNTLYALVFRWDGSAMLGNLAYTKAV